MYEATYGLSERPFQPIPQTRLYYPGRIIEEARTTLERVVDRGEGPGIVIGSAGTGKTLLCRLLAERFQKRFTVISVGALALGRRRDLFQSMLHEMKLPLRGMDEGELRLAVIDALSRPEIPTDGVLLLVDEAHMMSLRLIEELRLLTNIDHQGRPRVRLLLAADGFLEERLASPRLESLNQRLAARCYLQSLDKSEVGPYLAHHVMHAGATLEQLFLPEAIAAIATATDANPRLINQLADHALVCKVGQSCAAEPLTAADIQAAWADLQQLPAPWNTETNGAENQPSVIEFGPLEEETSLLADLSDAEPFEAPVQLEGTDDRTPDLQDDEDDEEPLIVELPSLHREGGSSEQDTGSSGEEWHAAAVIDRLVDDVASIKGADEELITPITPTELAPTAPAEDPFAEPFDEEVDVPQTAVPAESSFVPAEARRDVVVPGESSEIVSSHTPWLPIETLWVTPGTIPELPKDDRDLIELDASQMEAAAESSPNQRPHLLSHPSDLANLRQ